MKRQHFTDRSRLETTQRCLRARWWAYESGGGVGVAPARKSLPLAVGGAVHAGLAVLLFGLGEDEAIEAALLELEKSRPGGLELDTAETEAQRRAVETLGSSLYASAEEFGVPVSAQEATELIGVAEGQQAFERYLWTEQSALVEGLVRAWARRRLPFLQEHYEILEVEREGEWELAPGITFMSRPDALLRRKSDNTLWIQSFKTAATWDVRKERDAQRDMQSLSEGVEVERRLRERVHGIRYEYLLKGQRREDRDLSARVGFGAYTQGSILTRAYTCTSVPQRGKSIGAYDLGDVCWSWDYLKEDGSTSKLAWQNWHARPTWELPGGVREWVERLASSQEQFSAEDPTVGLEPRSQGWWSEAQRLGTTAEHPLDTLFPPVVEVYRNDDDVRDWLEQTEQAEIGVAQASEAVEAVAHLPASKRSLLNVYFPQSRHNCTYPSECPFANTATRPGPCFGPADFVPLESGRFVPRVPHHVPEAEAHLALDNAKEPE